MKIKKISIKNYKMFKDTEINLKKFNIIVGPNGFGKTTLFNLIKEGISKKRKSYDIETEGTLNKKQSKYIFIGDGAPEEMLNELFAYPGHDTVDEYFWELKSRYMTLVLGTKEGKIRCQRFRNYYENHEHPRERRVSPRH